MEIKIFTSLPKPALEIRTAVFVDEQGFTTEIDDKDGIAVHLVLFDGNGTPIATCRIFREDNREYYVLGRFAVINEDRGKNIGAFVLNEAEKYVKENGGKLILVHAQQRAAGFYKKSGFTEFGEVEYEEGCPHVCMKKYI